MLGDVVARSCGVAVASVSFIAVTGTYVVLGSVLYLSLSIDADVGVASDAES